MGSVIKKVCCVMGLLLGLPACQGVTDRLADEQQARGGLANLLPSISSLDTRSAAQHSQLSVNGSNTLLCSSGAVVNGTALDLPANFGGFEWALYQLTPGVDATLIGATVNFNLGATDEAWVAFADFSTNHWRFESGPLHSTLAFDPTSLSAEGRAYVAVVTEGSHFAQVDSITVNVNAPPGWQVTILDSEQAGIKNSLEVVNGTPAIAYWDYANKDLKFVRAANAEGKTWGVPQTLDNVGDVGACCSLTVVNNFPAVSYIDLTNSSLKYVRASDEEGRAWELPQIVVSDATVGWDTSLAIVNGCPAISFQNGDSNDLMYVRALDAVGSAWNTPQTLDAAANVSGATLLKVVNGFPAIVYRDGFPNSDLKYIQAQDPDGSAWGTPQIVDNGSSSYYSYSFAVVNGFPAVCFTYYPDGSDVSLRYVRATDVEGNAWGESQIVDSTVNARTCALAVVNGLPTISYFDRSSFELKYARATDADGKGWEPSMTIDWVEAIEFKSISLADLSGFPAVSYFDACRSNLKYAKLTP